jgi:hypothetical protein
MPLAVRLVTASSSCSGAWVAIHTYTGDPEDWFDRTADVERSVVQVQAVPQIVPAAGRLNVTVGATREPCSHGAPANHGVKNRARLRFSPPPLAPVARALRLGPLYCALTAALSRRRYDAIPSPEASSREWLTPGDQCLAAAQSIA